MVGGRSSSNQKKKMGRLDYQDPSTESRTVLGGLSKSDKPFQFIDLSEIFAEFDDTLYIDHCHYNDLAAEKFAEIIFESILPSLQQIKHR